MRFFLILFLIATTGLVKVNAQQRLDPKGMSFVYNPKPNSIYYHDTLYKGSAAFKYLFYHTLDKDLMRFYDKHQSNKVWGNVFTALGSVATLVGVSTLTSGSSNRSNGWILIGGGLASSITGGYLILKGQQNLMKAVIVFNERYAKIQAGIGVSNQQVGLVVNF